RGEQPAHAVEAVLNLGNLGGGEKEESAVTQVAQVNLVKEAVEGLRGLSDLCRQGLPGGGAAPPGTPGPGPDPHHPGPLIPERRDVATPALLALLVGADHLVALGAILQTGEGAPDAEEKGDSGNGEDQDRGAGGEQDDADQQAWDEGQAGALLLRVARAGD